jgi:hypothetical protein
MKTTTLQLLPTTSHGTPSGNYDGSSLDFDGVQQQAANYYGGFGSLQTIAFFLSGFQGRVRIQASLDSSPTTDAQWFQISDVDSTATSTTANFSRNINGNFVWIRARVTDFEAGNIEKIMMSY